MGDDHAHTFEILAFDLRQRKKGVVDGAKGGAGHQKNGKAKRFGQIRHGRVIRDGNEYAAGAFDPDEVPSCAKSFVVAQDQWKVDLFSLVLGGRIGGRRKRELMRTNEVDGVIEARSFAEGQSVERALLANAGFDGLHDAHGKAFGPK